MTRPELIRKILDVKRAKILSWTAIGPEIGGSPVYITAALLGQTKLRPERRAVRQRSSA